MKQSLLTIFFKRAFDIFSAFFGLIFLSPLFLIIAMLIKRESPGPVTYRGPRIGKDGKVFQIIKFRTMVESPQSYDGPHVTAEDDGRITSSGRWLRNAKLNELPQLWNVLKGEMSIVGPRPELAAYTEKYTKEERVILNVRPGITDYSSIEFRYLDEMVGERDADRVFEEKILPRKNELRIRYVKTQSFSGDLAIVFKTMTAIFSKPGKREL